MSCAALLQVLVRMSNTHRQVEAIEKLLASVADQPCFAEVSRMQAEAFKLQIGKAKLSLEETAHVSARLSEMNWAPLDLAGLVQHIASISCAESGMVARRSQQNFVNIENYLTEKSWSDLAAQKDLAADRLTSLCGGTGPAQCV